jgi:hypothetical protein
MNLIQTIVSQVVMCHYRFSHLEKHDSGKEKGSHGGETVASKRDLRELNR